MSSHRINYTQVALSGRAIEAWLESASMALALLPSEVRHEDLRDEECELLSDGSLRVFAPHPIRRRRVLAEIVVPADHWTWRH